MVKINETQYDLSQGAILAIIILLILLSPILLSSIISTLPWDSPPNKNSEFGTLEEPLTESASSIVITNSVPMDNSRGTRSRVDDKENNNNPWNATNVDSNNIEITGDCSATDDDWFVKRLDVKLSGGSEYVQNMTLTVNSLTGTDGAFLQIRIYGLLDINQNDKVDWASEMIFMKVQNYEIGGITPATIFINPYASQGYQTSLDFLNYYILFRTNAVTATYDFQLRAENIDPAETNQDIENPDTLFVRPTSTPEKHAVVTGYDHFDWFEVRHTPTSQNIGLNFTLNVKIDDCSNQKSKTIDGVTYHFVTILHILIFHEDRLEIGDNPRFPRKFQDHIIISQHPRSGYYYKIQYSDVYTLPTRLFRYTYVGFYVESYGIVQNKPEIKVYPFIDEIDGQTLGEVLNGWCEYSIEEAETKAVVRPVLSNVVVKSTTTNSIYGRTYDNYKYSVVYTQKDNNKPFVAEVSVFGLEGEIREEMSKITPGYACYETGCLYEVTISGLLLGEGDHHVFQFHFRDANVWSIGSYELGKSWHGPFISNNIRPFVRPTAPTKLTLYEDDNTTFFDLNTIFEDTDVDEELNFSIGEFSDEMEELVWDKSYNGEKLEAKIINKSRLQIDLKPNEFGEAILLLNVSDSKHYYLDSTFEFTIDIIPVNDPPMIFEYFTYLTILEDVNNTDVNLYDHFNDPIDNDELTFRVENNRNIDVIINQLTGDVTFTPHENWFGMEYIYFYASDGKDEVSDYINIYVKSVNDEPKLIINETIELWQDQWMNFTIQAFDNADNESVLIIQNLTEIFPNLETNPEPYGYSFDNVTGYLTLKPTNDMVGTYSWNISASDIHDSVNYTNVILIINNVNDPPVPRILAPATGARFLTTDKIAFKGTVFDPDKKLKGIEIPPITFTWESSLHGQRRKIGSQPNLEPQIYEAGTHTIFLSVNDGEVTRNTSIVIYIFVINKDLDSDNDEIPDYWENLFNLNINDPLDSNDDPDKDTFSNWEEYKSQTDPRDRNSFPDKHISRDGAEEDPYLAAYIGIFVLLLIILIFLILFIIVRPRVRKRKEKEAEAAKQTARDALAQKPYGIYKQPKVICHICGKSFNIMTLNRPVVVTCPDCGVRGAIYK